MTRAEQLSVISTVERLLLAVAESDAQEILRLTVGPLRAALLVDDKPPGSVPALLQRPGRGGRGFAARPFAVMDERNSVLLFTVPAGEAQPRLLYACLTRHDDPDREPWVVYEMAERGTSVVSGGFDPASRPPDKTVMYEDKQRLIEQIVAADPRQRHDIDWDNPKQVVGIARNGDKVRDYTVADVLEELRFYGDGEGLRIIANSGATAESLYLLTHRPDLLLRRAPRRAPDSPPHTG
jgi:hypothetical protein